jgi:acetyltransferase-like isoleucine patch superfamily enzyme
MVDVDDSAFDPRPVIYGGGGGGGGGSDGREVADEEGGGSMPTGGRVHSFYYGDPLFEALDSMTWKDCITWFMDPFRLAVIFSARIGHNIFGPLLQMAFVVLVKRLVIGTFKAGPLPRTFAAREWELTRRWIMNKLLPNGTFRGAVGVLGKHYDYTSYLYRALGAKIGRRVFWPGSGVLVADGMFDLLEVGDDVVWGSRSMVFPGDGQGAHPVKIGRGGNVSDRCVLYAGATLAEDACLGSGSVAGRKSRFERGSIWVGSRNGAAVQLDPGDPAPKGKDGEEEDLSQVPGGAQVPPREAKPFGRAVYQGKAEYFLPPWQLMPLLFSAFIALRTAYAVVPIWVSWYVVAVITWDLGNNFWTEMPEWRYLLLLVFVYLWVHMMHTVARFVFDVGLKWIVIGKREPGLYPWDRSSYCLRWKIFESLCSDTLHDLRYLGGSAFLPFFYNNCGSKIGRRVCLYPTGADPPMVEPDLVVVEDGACVNFAHIICHTNTLGSFALNHIVIKSGATLSTESRIMGGVVVGEDAVLLEHTMAMVGDVVEPGDIWQGWPVQAIAKAEEVAAANPHAGDARDGGGEGDGKKGLASPQRKTAAQAARAYGSL